MTTRCYVSSEAWRAIGQWPASTTPSVGAYCRQKAVTVFAGWSGFGAAGGDSVTANFGGSSFAHTPPSGFSAWDASATWDSGKAGAGIALSGGSLVATKASGSAWNTVLSTTGLTTGKKYYELTIGSISGSANQIVGAGIATMNLSSFLGDYASADRSIGYQSSSALVNISSGWNVGATYTAADVIAIAIDLDLRMIWFRKNGGNWNNDNTSNPATGVGGMGYGGFLSTLLHGNERVFKATTVSGNTGSSEPAWNLGNNATTTDGSVTWTQVSGHEAEQVAGNWKAPCASLQALANLALSPTSIYVSNDHIESVQINTGFSQFWGGIDVLSVTRTGSNLPPLATDKLAGATITTGGNNNCQFEAGYAYGFTLTGGCSNGGGSIILQPAGSPAELDTFTMDGGGTSAGNLQLGNTGHLKLINPLISSRQAAQLVITGQAWAVEIVGLQATSFNGTTVFAQGDGNYPNARFRGCDFSSATHIMATSLSGGRATSGLFDFEDCKLPANEPFGGSGTAWNLPQEYRFWNCENGGNKLSKFYQLTGMAITQSRTDVARSGGASDANGGFAWQITDNGSGNRSFIQPHRCTPLADYVTATGSSKTASVYLCATTALDNSLAWLELETLEDSGDTLGTRHTTRLASSQDTPATLTTDTSDWTAGATARANSHAYSQGDVIKVASNPGRLFVCTTAGTSAGSEPGGYATAVDGSAVTDSGATFTAVFRYVIQITFTPGRQGFATAWPIFGNFSSAAGFRMFVDPQLVVA